MRSTFTCLILGWALAMAGLVSCFRVPVQVVQYDEEPAITVAPVGTIHQVSASVAIMNPRVKDPALVGRLQPAPPSPIGGIDWATVGITALGLLGPVGLAVSNLLSQLRKAQTANRELVQGAQAVKEQFPKSSKKISATLASKQVSASTVEIVKKIKAKTKKPQGG
jgi:hypothetical protein